MINGEAILCDCKGISGRGILKLPEWSLSAILVEAKV
jgi:hypothetical protein